jgi:nucleoside phosphorylase
MTMPPVPPPTRDAADDPAARVRDEVTIGILAALPIEGAAMESLIDDARLFSFADDPHNYRVGSMPSNDPGRPHRVAMVVLSQDGTRHAAATCADLLRTFPCVRCVVMTGIAGGIPSVTEPDKHVRLGDVVVATQIVDYGAYRQEPRGRRSRRPPEGLISSRLRRAAVELQLAAAQGHRPWERWLDPEHTPAAGHFRRPPDETDVLLVRGIRVEHPDRSLSAHPAGRPKIHYGAVGSADVLMRDELTRDDLTEEHGGLVAVEMEASGIAAGTAEHELSWFMVRGIADYSANGKNDIWHGYASYAAAAYLRALLERAQPPPRVLPQVSLGQQDEIDSLLRRLPRGVQLRAAWDAAAGDLPAPTPELLGTPLGAFRCLAARNTGPSGLARTLMFVDTLADQADDPELAAELGRWVWRQASSMRAEEALARWRSRPAAAAEPHAHPCLLVEIAVDGIDRGVCRITSYIQDRSGPWRPRRWPGEPRTVALGEAEQVVGQLVDRAEREEWSTSETAPAIEFLLPAGLVNLPVEWWSPQLGLGSRLPLCVDYAVVVRSLERMRHTDRPRWWSSRWSALRSVPSAGRVLWGADPQDDEQLREWEIQLRTDPSIAAVVLSSPPDRWPGLHELARAIVLGVPVVLWDRRAPRPADAGAQLHDLVDDDPAGVRARTGVLRSRAAAGVVGRPEQLGRFVALLWDNPQRLIIAGRGAG